MGVRRVSSNAHGVQMTQVQHLNMKLAVLSAAVSQGIPPVVPISIHEVSVRMTRHPVITSLCAG